MYELQRKALRAATEESRGWIEAIRVGSRVENQAAAAQLVAIGELFRHRLAHSGETEDWAIDTMEAVAAEVAAGLKISQGRACDRLVLARALSERLPRTGAVLRAGLIDVAAFATIVFRTDLITDPEILALVDERVAANVARWPSLTAARLAKKVDAIVARVDADAVRRRKERNTDRELVIGEDQDGVSSVEGRVRTTDAHALDASLSALAATVCPHDPRTHQQRRADAIGALAARATRLACLCGRTDCTAGARRPASPVIIHVIAEQATLNGTGNTAAAEIGANGLITADLVAELAQSAHLVPLIHPGYSPPEPQYRPSTALVDFVRARDLTCRFPGCDTAATHCDLDHTIAYAAGGATHAGNLKCLCRKHHLIKTFWGWRDQQLPDGTLIWTSPAGDTHVTTPGSALLFPSLCHAVGGIPTPETVADQDYCTERTAMMPKRRRTRAQDRDYRVAAERQHNRQARQPAYVNNADPTPPCNDPPPF
ncbi:hypothetical protein A5634_09970 [Mycobacterium asiaticum]|uniref:HNH nuclease domain-containing protein n=1 Tax=Mycobacterium asiaticum TaxID=1790 RepID=A0A1A3NMS0_MYCAS|nr:HNH endonuclease signature motif containing protein [Mycobacterium asiaticum]OBK21632.1 hypothetical protein A5634_09970 [Mycobacterium asiaticum]